MYRGSKNNNNNELSRHLSVRSWYAHCTVTGIGHYSTDAVRADDQDHRYYGYVANLKFKRNNP